MTKIKPNHHMKVIQANYINNYTIELEFEDQKKNVINFLPALKKYPNCAKFLDTTLFKNFKIESGNIVWGKNWDMIFTIESLYHNTLYA